MEGQDYDEPRRSSRANLEVPPERYGEWVSKLPSDIFQSTGIFPSNSEAARIDVARADVKRETGDYLDREISRMEQKLRDTIDQLT